MWCGLCMPLSAQIVQPARMELELKDGEEYYSIVSAEEEGIVLYRENIRESRLRRQVYDIICLDSELKERWKSQLEVEGGKLTGYEYSAGKVYLLFREESNKADNYQIFTLDVATSLTARYTIDNAIPVELSEFTVVDNVVLLGGYVNFRPTVIYFDLLTDKYRVVPGLYANNSEILEIKTSEENKTFSILHTERLPDKQYTITTKTFDRECNLLFDFRLKPEPDRNLLYGRTTSFGDDALHIAGTYSHGNTKFSRGIFIANIHPDGSQNIKYYNYGDLKNFFSYMKARREKRMRNRIERRKIKGKKVKLNYKLLVHDVLEKKNSNILLGEAFYPKYSSRPNYNYAGTYSGFNRALYPNLRHMEDSNLDGYQYTHAVVIGFDQKGNLLWDNSFEINDVVSPTLQKFVQVLPFDTFTVLLYMYEHEIRSKIIQKDEVLEGKTSDDIATLYEGDDVQSTGFDMGGLKEWYGPYFYAFGVQRIRNNSVNGGNKDRKVFFVNKITYEPQQVQEREARGAVKE